MPLLIELILTLAIAGFLLWLLVRFVPMPQPFPQIIIALVVLAVIVWILQASGIWTGYHGGIRG